MDSNLLLNQIKSIAESRNTETLKEDILEAFKNMNLKNTDVAKLVYHALNDVLFERLSAQDFTDFEESYRK